MKTHMRFSALGVGLLLGLIGAGCASPGGDSTAWQARLAEELPVFGHRNWIVIADSAYPAQSGQGIETVYTDQSQLKTLEHVLGALDRVGHVEPVVHLDAELAHVPESLAPGITAYRTDLERLLKGRRVERLPHEELIGKLDEAGKVFRVLILKTDLTLPYTSVFLELDCGYWGPEEEEALRSAIAAP